MSYAVALAALVLFVIGFRLAGIIGVARDAILRTQAAVAMLRDRNTSEEQKEIASRQAAVVLFGRFFAITGLTFMVLVPSLLVIIAAIWVKLADQDAIIAAIESPWLIAAAILGFVLDYAFRK